MSNIVIGGSIRSGKTITNQILKILQDKDLPMMDKLKELDLFNKSFIIFPETELNWKLSNQRLEKAIDYEKKKIVKKFLESTYPFAYMIKEPPVFILNLVFYLNKNYAK